jgi:hypothetical protein
MAMTEEQWLNCASATQPVFRWLGRKGSDRKFFLAGAAAVRHIISRLRDPRSLAAIDVLERFADGAASAEEREAAHLAALNAGFGPGNPLQEQHFPLGRVPDEVWRRTHATYAASYAIMTNAPGGKAWYCAYNAMHYALKAEKRGPMAPWQADLLRDIFGNPFRPVKADPRWQTANALALAKNAYADRELPSGRLSPTLLGILADALEEAGCTESTVLDHLRAPHEHFRGCWAADLVLGKK